MTTTANPDTVTETTTSNDTEQAFIEQIQVNPLATVARYYASCLSASPKAAEYIKEQLRLTPDEVVERQVGFSNRTLGKHIPHRRLKLGREVRDLLLSLGLYKANGREVMRGRVTEPILGASGNTIAIRGYKIDPHAAGPETILIGREVNQPHGASHRFSSNTPLAAQPPLVARVLPSNAMSSRLPPHSAPRQEQAEPETQSVPSGDAGNESQNNLIVEDDQLIFIRDDRRYRIRGLEKNTSSCQLKVNIMASRDDLIHLDTLDLVKARSRTSFIKATAVELYVEADIVKKDIGQLLMQLESLQSERIAQLKKPKQVEVKLTEDEQREALELLRDPNLLQRVVADLGACGMVGEDTNKLTGYLAATSRKLNEPLAIVIQSSSSAGKTSLMDAILAMMPAEDVQRFSGMTGQSLFYLDSDDIRHKTLAISEDEGIAEATYALKLLQSEGELRHATVGRGPDGRAVTQTHHVEGPVQIFLTTTAMDIDEELVNRCMVLSVDETRGQTSGILAKQREARQSAARHGGSGAKRLRSLHCNAQRLIRPLEVHNLYATQLTFPNHKTRLRRDHQKYLTLIDTIALLHQHQRTVYRYDEGGDSVEYIRVELNDIAVANGIAGEVLGRSLDELSPQTRNCLSLTLDFVRTQAKSTGVSRSAFRFTRRDLRESLTWSDFQLRTHLKKLVELEYLIVHRGKQGRRFVYELQYAGEGREGQPFLMGLIDPAKLITPTTKTSSIAGPTSSIEKAG